MGLWPTRGNDNQHRHPREGGGPFFSPLDSRFRGNDVTFGGAAGDEESRSAPKTTQSQIPCRARNDNGTGFRLPASGTVWQGRIAPG